MTALRILSICGSRRPQSRVKAGLMAIDQVLAGRKVETTLWNLGQNPLPFMDPDTRGTCGIGDRDLARFLELARSADGYVLGSPIYHNSYSGLLKNALDHLSMRDLGGKAFALTSHGGNRSPQAVDHLRIIVRSVQGIAIPVQLCTDEEDFVPAQNGEMKLSAPPTLERLERLVDELMEFATILRARRDGRLFMLGERENTATDGLQAKPLLWGPAL